VCGRCGLLGFNGTRLSYGFSCLPTIAECGGGDFFSSSLFEILRDNVNAVLTIFLYL
jgi:hypothetical protein